MALTAAMLLTLGGCSTIRVTDPSRTASEQFLLSEAGREAVAQIVTEPLRDRQVFVDSRSMIGDEREFIVGELRAHLLLQGVRLVEERQQAQIVVEVRSGGVGIDRYESLVGLPPLQLSPAMAPGVGTKAAATAGALITPELAIVKNIKQRGFASVALVAYWRESGEVVGASGPFVGKTFRDDWWFLGMGPRVRGNIPTIPQE